MLRRAASVAYRRHCSGSLRWMSDLPSTATPPANTARGATADLCDVFVPEPVDKVTQCPVQIADPIFRCV
jgi:hypothetical protein